MEDILYHFVSRLERDSFNLSKQDRRIIDLCVRITRVVTKDKHQTIKMDSYPIPEILYGKCYICKTLLVTNEHTMCTECNTFNQTYRNLSSDQTGKIAVITGGRIKMGFHAALKLLRANATTIVSTRFPRDAYKRYQSEPDYTRWKDRLFIVQADFLYLNNVREFVRYVASFGKIHYLINNAAQTIARPQEFYRSLLEQADQPSTITESVVSTYFPVGQYDKHQQQIDLRPTNSWVETIEEVRLAELVNVLSINTIVPFYLIQQLCPLVDSTENPGFIINVSSMEGKFNRYKHNGHHPHTNIAKAGLNMITKTIGTTFKRRHNIVVVSVDTGWNTIEEPLSYERVAPLDCIDGAARILHPIFSQLTKSGIFYKDYKETSW
jgi:NAD(P)-dependent dehydrogenase (short-subunit alcohol dehydrogenase family)